MHRTDVRRDLFTNPMLHADLNRHLHAMYPLPDPDWQDLSAYWQPFTARRKTSLTAAGETESYLYFVGEGVQRVYYLDEQGREATLVFSYAPSLSGVIDSLLLQQPSRYFFETLTPSTFLRIAYTDLQAVMARRPAVAALVRLGTTQALAGVLERLVELQCYSSAEKFRALLHRSPHLLQRVPHRYLASYIGVDPTNFSKLLNAIRL